jgi:hypothetical protein
MNNSKWLNHFPVEYFHYVRSYAYQLLWNCISSNNSIVDAYVRMEYFSSFNGPSLKKNIII